MKQGLYTVAYWLHTMLARSQNLWVICHDFMLISAYTIFMHWGIWAAVVTNIDMAAFVRLFLCNNTLKCYIRNLFFMYKQKL